LENSSAFKSSDQDEGNFQGSASHAYAGPIDFPLNEEHLVLGDDVREAKRAKDFGLPKGLGELLVEHCMVETHDRMLQGRFFV
jgi:hypothetical protein